MGDLLDAYRTAGAYDEMFTEDVQPREHYASLSGVLQTLSRRDFEERCDARDRAFRDAGITFQLSGEERPFPLDLVPRILPAEEWATIEQGVRQRVLALEAFLADVYGPGRILHDGVIPRRLVVTSTNFQRAAAGIEPPRGVRVHVAGIDLVRDGNGRFRVLEDNLRTPSGISYVIENRRAMTRVFPELFASHRVRRVADYPTKLLEALRDDGAGRQPRRGGADPGRAQRRVLRALVPGPADGRRAGRGQRPGVPRQPRGHADHRGSATGGRGVSPHRRRLPRPAALPGRLRARLPGHRERGPGRDRDDRERGGQRRRRRQGALPVRPRHGALLPG